MTTLLEHHRVEIFLKNKFTDDETGFLRLHVPTWLATFYSTEGAVEKGVKKLWVDNNIYPLFIEKFYKDIAQKPNAQYLKDKLYRWFLNRKNSASRGPQSCRRRSLLKKPRSLGGLAYFALEKRDEITQQSRYKIASSPGDKPLDRYRAARRELWDALDEDTKALYQRKASEYNKTLVAGPTTEVIESVGRRNQDNIIQHTMEALGDLSGRHWRGHGDVAFFVMGACRRKDGQLSTFRGSVSNDEANDGFQTFAPDFENNIRAPFKEWASKVLPYSFPQKEGGAARDNGHNSMTIPMSVHEDGFPLLPGLDPDRVPPYEAKVIVRKYLEEAWKCSGYGSSHTLDVPWDILGTKDRSRILQDPKPFEHFQSLNPADASIGDTYNILGIILSQQGKGQQPLRFLNAIAHIAYPRRITETTNQVVAHNTRIDFSPPKPVGQA
ncbi:hypothetical protein CVT26_008773 [Gymnopilus dilepis]|uniref:Uncharacterized protein n=1 Tax=Gymnopilus dilepis TaxID=231916 RepID=A0A409WX78_9AGAR|nr:hypothetical protein CVT26_008773 [Gymnopilus dilepis]